MNKNAMIEGYRAKLMILVPKHVKQYDMGYITAQELAAAGLQAAMYGSDLAIQFAVELGSIVHEGAGPDTVRKAA